MITADQRPTGTPGTAPRGPAGPSPEPRGPKPSAPKPNTQKPPAPSPTNGTGGPWPSSPGPSAPSGPTGPGRLARCLVYADRLLRDLQELAEDLDGMDPALRVQLDSGLRTARRAVAAAKTPGRRDHEAAAVAPAIATTGGPAFSLPHPVDLPSFEVGVGPLYDALPAVNGSLARRAD